MISTFVSIPGYRISQELYNGSRTLVYRGYRETDELPVVIKLLKNPYPSFSELLSFRNQYTIAKNLNSPLIVQTYSLQAYQNAYALVMEDFGGISLKDYFTSPETQYIASSEEFLEIAIALCNALYLLYRERIIHKDIKPANILINPETKQVKLIDFSIASLLPRETQTLINPNVLEGTLTYISPEQTGRMNRGIDYRTDFYSLGVTFYELLTGELPFKSNDPMELVHCHIAKASPLGHEINSEIPSVLSEIVTKLMAKNAESRYQSALGIKLDLENCLEQLQATGTIKTFEIAQRDVCDRFIIPERLYGREQEVKILLNTFERVSQGSTEMILVAGFSGIGKTAVVNEVHKPIVRQRGYFIKGKYDQFGRNIPFSAFVQAFRDLMGQLLSESDVQLEQWRDKILSALGENSQVIIEVIPELERILGKQPSVPDLSGSAAQNRFNLLFEKFIQVFTTIEHPLVIFIDDLQWADSASLKLMHLLMSKTDSQYLLLIGAYRDNEVSSAHPLMLTLQEIEKAKATINTITLAPLDRLSVNQLIADTLSCSLDLALPLTDLVISKTKGNPFFSTQFLKALYEDGLITFNFDGDYWECDIAEVRSLSLTDDVVEFMALQLQKLPSETQDILKLAACIGNSFDLKTLAIVYEKSQTETAADLWKALQEGLILPITEVYKFFQSRENIGEQQTELLSVPYRFLHDRVQQAAYSLLKEGEKTGIHYHIGQTLWQSGTLEEIEAQVFAIVDHLNMGIKLVTESREREEIVKLNLQAGQKAKASTAYNAAVNYLRTGRELLGEQSWTLQYQLTLDLHLEGIEAEYLGGNYEVMQDLFNVVLQRTKTVLEQIKAYQVIVQFQTSQNQMQAAIDTGLQVVENLGVHLAKSPPECENPEALYDLEEMKNQTHLSAIQILVNLFGAAFVANPGLLPSIIFTMVNLSLVSGNSIFAPYIYSLYGYLLCTNIDGQSIELGYQYGQLGSQLIGRLRAKAVSGKAIYIFNTHIRSWKEHIQVSMEPLRDAMTICLEAGDLEFAGYSTLILCENAFLLGVPLDSALKQQVYCINFAEKIKQEYPLIHNRIFGQLTENLMGEAHSKNELVGSWIDEEKLLPILQASGNQTLLYMLYLAKTAISYTLQDFAVLLTNSQQARSYEQAIAGNLMIVPSYFYHSLSLLVLYPDMSSEEQNESLPQVVKNQETMKIWAEQAPMNFQHKYDLVEAERHRVLGQKAEAMELYDRAISGAKEQGYIQEEALANELAAKFYLHWGKERIAQEYMTQAYYGYARWGAKAKVADLEKRYPQLLAPILEQTHSPLSTNETIFTLGSVTSRSSATSSSSSSISVALDLATILKASQTLSSEIELEKLLASLLSIVIENAGADKCVFMLLRDNRLLIKGSITQGSEPVVLQRLPIEESEEIPLKLIYKVLHNKETVVLLDAIADRTLANDPYIIRQQPKSILCSPILHQGKLMGILYLENNLATGAFTSDRVELLNLLCAQAAISLENAQLYERSLKYAQQLEESFAELSASNSRFERLVDNVPGVVYQYSISADGVISLTYISADCYNLLEITPEQAMSNWQFFDNLVHPDDVVSYQQSKTEALQALCPWQWSGQIITPSRIIKWIHGESGIQKFADGSMVWDGLFLDISEQQAALGERQLAELALQQKSLALENALNDLQHAQLQIVQSEKMSALGNLVAGVAHEINNPVGCIIGNVGAVQNSINDLFGLIDLYNDKFPQPGTEIEEELETIDLEYLRDDLPKLVRAMKDGGDRIKSISKSLRTFSRADSDQKQTFNLHEGIDSTILILRHRLKASETRPAIEVVTNYGNIPAIACFPGQLNQVFMNILANAIDALDESNNGRSFAEIQANPNCINIQTSVENEKVKIAISDNGKGMSESVKQKIFNHLFTTKAVGKGTGLGLAIARQIVESTHSGKLSCNSVLGLGTEFIIEIPV
ncbi:MAG: AAA family ATPase [Nostoc sp.]|uniref:trifunctional serine/threonine-protein kinase/ATP-binding protein/sensor histidine kinase n=1 Tax=Nostoc sp. TaxID=1180 RepID=UPI002FF59358